MKNQTKAYIFAISAILLWSTVATAFKIGLQHMDFIQLLFYSSLTALFVLFVFIVLQNKLSLLKFNKKSEFVYSAALGLLNPFGYYMVLLKAYSILPAQLAQPLNYTWPIMLVILSAIILKQKMSLKSYIAIFISFLGVFFISSRGNLTNYNISEPLGVFLASGSSIIWALFWIYNVKDKRDEIVKLFFNFLFGCIYILIALLLFSKFEIQNSKGFLSTTYLGFFEMGITFVLWLKAMQLTTNNAKISNLVFISPFMALIFIHFILGEQIFWTTLLGLVFIIAGIVIQQVKFKKLLK